VAMNTGTQAAKEAGNMVDLDSNPTKLIEVVEIGKQMLMTRGALTTFSLEAPCLTAETETEAPFPGWSRGGDQCLGFVLVLHFGRMTNPTLELAAKASRVDVVGQMQLALASAGEAGVNRRSRRPLISSTGTGTAARRLPPLLPRGRGRTLERHQRIGLECARDQAQRGRAGNPQVDGAVTALVTGGAREPAEPFRPFEVLMLLLFLHPPGLPP